MKTYTLSAKTRSPRWWLVDADGQILGRLASAVAVRLMGKDQPHYTPHLISGDIVVVVNAAKVKVTGNKLKAKKYYSHSGYPGGISGISLGEQLEKDPRQVIIHAVRGMLPKNKLAAEMLKNLKVFANAEHPHTAQQPTKIEVI